MKNTQPSISLSNGVRVPQLGLGVWQIKNDRVPEVVQWAIKAGYRHIDTAKAYQNEEGVGRGIQQSGIDRKELFVTTKLMVTDFFRPTKAFNTSLGKLDLKYVDLYLLHWPFLGWKKAWLALEEIYQQGRTKAIGVSNFNVEQLQVLKKLGKVKPMVNQVELSPFLQRTQVIEYCQAEGIAVEAYSPLTRGKRLQDPLLTKLAAGYQKSAAQILIRWGLQHSFIMIPKSDKQVHIESNFDVFDFEIDHKDMLLLDQLNDNFSALFPGWSRG